MSKGGAVVLSFVAGILVIPVAAFLYLGLGKPPVATGDTPFPFEAAVVEVPLHARIHREMPKSAPLQVNDENMTAGAAVYKQNCSFCHGDPGKTAAMAKNMYPRAPQLWAKHHDGVVGVSDDPPGETYWKVKNGIRLSGMPGYQGLLTEDQMWQVSLLLANADKALPASAQAQLAP